MVFAVIALGICQMVFFAGVCRLLTMWFDHKQQEIEDRITGELAKLTTGEPCQSASILLAIGEKIGSEAGRSAKASFMQSLSVAKRNANSDADDAAAAAVGDSNPALGAVLSGLGPRSRRGLFKNPLVQLAMSAFMGGGNAGLQLPLGGNGNNGGGSVQDRIRKQS